MSGSSPMNTIRGPRVVEKSTVIGSITLTMMYYRESPQDYQSATRPCRWKYLSDIQNFSNQKIKTTTDCIPLHGLGPIDARMRRKTRRLARRPQLNMRNQALAVTLRPAAACVFQAVSRLLAVFPVRHGVVLRVCVGGGG